MHMVSLGVRYRVFVCVCIGHECTWLGVIGNNIIMCLYVYMCVHVYECIGQECT